jgi:hypothetical protein
MTAQEIRKAAMSMIGAHIKMGMLPQARPDPGATTEDVYLVVWISVAGEAVYGNSVACSFSGIPEAMFQLDRDRHHAEKHNGISFAQSPHLYVIEKFTQDQIRELDKAV